MLSEKCLLYAIDAVVIESRTFCVSFLFSRSRSSKGHNLNIYFRTIFFQKVFYWPTYIKIVLMNCEIVFINNLAHARLPAAVSSYIVLNQDLNQHIVPLAGVSNSCFSNFTWPPRYPPSVRARVNFRQVSENRICVVLSSMTRGTVHGVRCCGGVTILTTIFLKIIVSA